ncbi:related to Pre-rRNA-processing protein ESF2 [Saccharomycodes ludwigii]|uniref:Pre-rRNA-processing protein ESF2 n=1 Tax=Saccharomycodes ludwigii TaxID=36035 RepID=A0A376B8N9_9ASCO|nr:hypothetical protein SCDLUD_003786 [Saccharomycodes ludwigii]KAH3900780.1 hypothetical protein SCDLUD_003786 [Saccharomycodes ludwigii]SSD61063.1 related to Pre-rRNA-processing protein ESF2 [Saccharomycodes ludwigii]
MKDMHDSDFSSSDDEDNNPLLLSNPKKVNTTIDRHLENELEEEESDINQEDDKEEKSLEKKEENKKSTTPEDLKKEKLNRLKKLKATKKSKHKTGVVYFSRIPPYMKPAKMRQILSRFGEVDRLFLKREEEKKYKQRVRSGGNKKVMYEEGWAEFIRKKDAKLCASTLNANIIGGKKGSFYHDDIMNVKYLPGFKWADLTEQIARENDVRQAKLQLEISQANKLNSEFIRNVEKSKMLSNIRESKKRKGQEVKGVSNNSNNQGIKQRKITTNRANASDDLKKKPSQELNSVLNSLF